MLLPESWANRNAVVNHLAWQLTKGRLALFLGAGVSKFYGVPEWSNLVNKLCDQHGEAHSAPGGEITKVGAIKLKYYRGNDAGFLADVKQALFDGVSVDFEKIRQSPLLSAIGALLIASKRGAASQIITLNYDDLVELYLEYHGLVVRSVSNEFHWESNADVTVYHPHGLLALDPQRDDSENIVFGTADYHEIMRPESAWRSKLLTILRTHTTIYVGLSGTDQHLQTLLSEVNRSHAIQKDRYAYHGVRFTTEDSEDDVAVILGNYGVATLKLESWDDLAVFLFEVCQAARKLRQQEI